MQIVIPMSGFGERFRRAGYQVPKPLIPVDGKPIIAHVIDLFPGETDFLFICNEDHLADPTYEMSAILKRYCPTGRIVAIPAHREGPIGAVRQARRFVDPARPVFVNYCDFTCYWDWADFKRFAAETRCRGAIPAYRGFHPHSLGSTYYAYCREENGWLLDIQEKQPFTETPMDEYASSGGYYFATGELCLSAFDEVMARDINVNGEHYASLAYKVLGERGEPTAIYDIQHFMQWGTPHDLTEYLGWSSAFRRLAFDDGRRARQGGSVLVPMAGLGSRFAKEGYALPKPMIPVSGRPMVIQATRDLPDVPATRFVLRADLPMVEAIEQKLRTSFVGTSTLVLDETSDGQATTCALGIKALDQQAPVTIGACDNAMLYDTGAFEVSVSSGEFDLLVWVVRGHADGRLRPEMFGWVETNNDGVPVGTRVKQSPDDPATAPMIVGTFTFARGEVFTRCYEDLRARDLRVNGEFYVDSMVDSALALGLRVGLFEIDHYLGWGTPKDLKIFEYWQSCFHKWAGSPYRLERDKRIPASAVAELAERYKATVPARPFGLPSKR